MKLSSKFAIGAVVAVLFTGVLAITWTLYNPSQNQDQRVTQSLDAQRAALFTYFKSFGMLPILIPEGQMVGDVYDLQSGSLKDQASRCFPGLEIGEFEATTLPTVLQTDKASAAALFNLPAFASGSGSARYENVVSIRYIDARVKKVSLSSLRSALSSECAYLRPLMNGTLVDPDGLEELPLIISRVIYGKPEFFIGLKDGMDFEGEASLADFSLEQADTTAQVTFKRQGDRGLILSSNDVLPVAFTPAFLPTPIFDEIRGSDEQPDPTLVGYEWKDFENSVFDPDVFGALLSTSKIE